MSSIPLFPAQTYTGSTSPFSFLNADYASTGALTATYSNGSSLGVGATLTNAGAMVAFAIDGASPAINSRILIKNQASTFQNGIYTLTTVGSGAVNWVLTRATDYDSPSEITSGDVVAITNGTVNAITSWLQTATVTTIGTDPIVFSQFSYAPTSFLLKANNLSDVAAVSTSRNNLGLGTAQNVSFEGIFLTGTGGAGYYYVPRQNAYNVLLSTGLLITCSNTDQAVFDTMANKKCILDFNSIATSDKTFTFPNTSGTLALTSNLSAYALAGANADITSMSGLTGALGTPTTVAIKTHAAFAGSAENLYTAAATTTNNTITTLYSLTLSDNTVYYYSVDITARRSDSGTENGRFTRNFLVYRQSAGTATLGATIVVPWTDEQLTMTGSITIDTNTNDVRVRVTGENAKTIQWVASVRYQAVSGSA